MGRGGAVVLAALLAVTMVGVGCHGMQMHYLTCKLNQSQLMRPAFFSRTAVPSGSTKRSTISALGY
ncbi:hypothetical protein GOP47_0031122 [Adiantum capillus-veneris]|nr:hypothetical protein GOP47_0031122 [Adiantum capillus-veneris]